MTAPQPSIDEILTALEWQRRRRCGFCDGVGSRWSPEHGRMERCRICRGRKRGTLMVWNDGPRLRRRVRVDYGE